jgi:hypothetical protein
LNECTLLFRTRVLLRPALLLLFALAAAFALTASSALRAASDDQPETVGSWGEPNRLEITGAVQVERRFILGAIRGDVDIQLAALANAPLVDYLDTLRRRITLVYRQMGFPEARVECRSDHVQNKIAVRIDEGARWYCGDVRVEGAERIAANDLIRLLCQRRPPDGAMIDSFDRKNGRSSPHWVDENGNDAELSEPIWRKGDEASVSDAADSLQRQQIAPCLAALGFPAAKFEVETRPNVADKSAELIIHLTSEGPGPTIRNVQISGHKTNPEQAILDYAGIKTGESYSRERAAEWRWRLWRSGRFVRCKISAVPCDTDKQGLTLRVEVSELKSAPPLDKPLSAKEATFLKCREWLAASPARDDDLVATASPTPGGCSATIVISRRGALMLINDIKLNADGSPRPRYALLLESGSVGCYAFQQRTKILLPANFGTHATCHWGLAIDDNDEQVTNLKMNIGWESEGCADSPAIVTFGGAPAAFLRIAHDENSTIANGRLRSEREDFNTFEIDATTGALRLTTKAKGQVPPCCLEFQQGVYERIRRQIDAESATFTNTFDNRHPISSAIAPIVENGLWRSILGDAAVNRNRFAAAKKLLANGAFQPLDESIVDLQSQGMAFPPVPIASTRTDWSENSILALLLPTYILTGSDCVFARDSWPWSLCRAYAFAFIHPEAAGEQMVLLVQPPNSGPLRCACTAAVVNQVGGDAVEIAKLGRTRLTLDDFRNDYRPLLEHRSLFGRELFAIAGALRTLNAEEVDALCAGLAPDDAKCFRTAVAELRASPDEPLDKLLPQVLDHCWENGLKARVEAALESLATEARSAGKSTTAASRPARRRDSEDTADAAQRAELDLGMARNR